MSGGELLESLRAGDGSEAWKRFLERYSSLILRVAAQFETEADLRSDCFVFVCDKLSDNGFRRLLQYEPEGPASFRSWLNVVVANLCIDWKRHKDGRARAFRSIQKLSPLEQMVFKFRFLQGLNRAACLASLQPSFPGLTEQQVSNAIAQVNTTLSQNQQWRLSVRHAETLSLNELQACEPADHAPGPEQSADNHEREAKLREALATMAPRQRLLIRLRYQQELSLKEIARLTRLGDPFRARRELQKALAELRRLIDD